MKRLLPTKLKVVLLFTFLLSLLGSSFYAGRVLAADAFPPPGKIPCTETRANEFSSDRPYQGSPCGDRPISYFCGNTVVIYLGTVSVPYCGEKTGQTSCPANIHKDQTIDVDLTDVELPILGNTQQTINNQNTTDQIDDGTKVSSYVAWYLNGTDGKAEYPISNTATADEISKAVDTAGPINKLLPQAIANAQRIDTITTATKKDPQYIDEETGELVSSQPPNHDQIVVCANGGNPVECDKGGKKYRLKDWDDGKLSLLSTFFNFLGAEIWNNRYPPLPWQFTKEIFYEKAYNEWRGSTCVIVPIINRLVCADVPLVSPTRVWADLFPYVPLANTVDKKGSQMVTDTNIQAPKATLENAYSVINNIPQLYLAHSLENSKLAALLKATFKPKDNLVGSTTPKDVEDNSTTCRILNSKTNPGDDATFVTPKSHINVDVHYDVTEIKCSDPKYNSLVGYWRATCESEVYATIPSVSKTPYADEIWKDTVAGSDSIFRRIYPKTGSNSPVSCIADTPAVSAATYTLNEGLSSSGLKITKVVEPDGSDVLAQTGTNAVAAQLYYPHYGGVLDYFLSGIQTALRPQGYGESTPISGTMCQSTTPKECTVNVSDSSVPSKYLGSFKANFIDLANRWDPRCPGESNNMATKCYNYVVSEAKKAGVNPAFALTIWLNETGASNYCTSGKTAQDFGINLPDIYQNIVEQLKVFLRMAKTKLCSGVAGFSEPMDGWLSRFQSSAGKCDPADATARQYYIDVRDNTWTWVTGCPKNGKFGITWPTDMSCP